MYIILAFRYDGFYFIQEMEDMSEIANSVDTTEFSIFFKAESMHYYYCSKPIYIKISTATLNNSLKTAGVNPLYMQFIIEKYITDNPVNIVQFNDIDYLVGEFTIKTHSPSNSLNVYVGEKVIGMQPTNHLYPCIILSDHYPIEFWQDPTVIIKLIPKRNGETMTIKKDFQTAITITTKDKIINIGHSSNIIKNELDINEEIEIKIELDKLASYLNAAEFGPKQIIIKIHPIEPPIFIYRIMDKSKNLIASMTFRIPIAKEL